MKKVSKIIIICMLITITLLTMFFLNKKESNKSNGMFAIMLETSKGTGKYEHAKDNRWPQSEEYVINMYKTYCEKGSVLRWNNETKKINATVKGADKCYVYFDLSEYGNEEHPYLIQTIEDLVRLSNDVNNGTTYAGKYFLLTNDLDFQDEADYENANRVDFKDINGINGDETLITELTTGSGFKQIGNSEANSFQGIFDGGNHTISNLFINRSDYVGFFGVIKNAEIFDLTMKGDITTSKSAGGISVYSYGKNKIINVNNYANITGITGGNIGGIVGLNMTDSLIIRNCVNTGIINNSFNAGGLVGYNNAELTIENTQNKGEINNTLGRNIGGFIGNSTSTSKTTILNSHNEGNINCSDSEHTDFLNVGGLMGYTFNEVHLENSYNQGNITTRYLDYDRIGGLIGMFDNTDKTIINVVKNSYNEGKISGGNIKGGLFGLLAANTNMENCYNEGDFEDDIPILVHENWRGQLVYGGLVGVTTENTAVEIKIKNCYNLGNVNIKSETTGGITYGGLIGSPRCYTIIESSYNKGNITAFAPALQIGGIIGYQDRNMLAIVNKVYNAGNIIYNDTSDSWVDPAGGIVGFMQAGSVYILNSYNIGKIEYGNPDSQYGEFSGLIGLNIAEGNQYIINSYNLGKINTRQIGTGIVYSTNNKTKSIISNVFNIGSVEAKTANAIYYVNSTANNTINNTYYLDNVANGGNIPEFAPIKKSESDMKQQTFVDELNQNAEIINLGEIDEKLKDYKLSQWLLGSNDYPTLVNE